MTKIPKRGIRTDLNEYIDQRMNSLNMEIEAQPEQRENWNKIDVMEEQLESAGQDSLRNEYSNMYGDIRYFGERWMYQRGMQEGAVLLLFLLGMDGPLGMPAGRYEDE